jgi:hypothetical protein
MKFEKRNPSRLGRVPVARQIPFSLAMLRRTQKIIQRNSKPIMKMPALLFRAGLFCLLLAGVTGCSSLGKPASASFASVEITNSTPQAIRATTIEVFQEAEFGAFQGPDAYSWVFEREATKGESLAYNGVVATHYGQITLNRVRTKLLDRGNGRYRLSCQAYIVTDATSFMGGYENPLTSMRSGPYQKLLDKVAGQLNKPPPQ